MPRVLAKLALVFAMILTFSGCELLRPNFAQVYAVESAGYAGRFRLAHGRWPSMGELEEFMCMHGRADKYGLGLRTCEEVVNPPYTTLMSPLGRDLQMQFFNSGRQNVCRLTVRAPEENRRDGYYPTIVIETTVFSCRGDGGYCPWVAM